MSPTYSNPDIELRFVEILPDSYDPNGYAKIVFYYFLDNKRVVIEVKQIDESYVKQANEKGVREYMEALYGSKFKNAKIYKANIKTKNGLASESGNQSVSYIKTTIESEASKNSRTQRTFLLNGFEVNIYQQKDSDDNRFIKEICLETVSFNKSKF